MDQALARADAAADTGLARRCAPPIATAAARKTIKITKAEIEEKRRTSMEVSSGGARRRCDFHRHGMPGEMDRQMKQGLIGVNDSRVATVLR